MAGCWRRRRRGRRSRGITGLKAETEAGGGLGDVVELTVVGAPETIYLTATPIDVMEESNGDVREYILRAEVVDPAGRQVAPGYTLRWRVALRGGESTLSAESSPVQRGVATSRLRIEDPVGEPRLQVWLIEAPKVESEGALEDLAASGLALRPGINAVTWVGATKSVDAAGRADRALGGDRLAQGPGACGLAGVHDAGERAGAGVVRCGAR